MRCHVVPATCRRCSAATTATVRRAGWWPTCRLRAALPKSHDERAACRQRSRHLAVGARPEGAFALPQKGWFKPGAVVRAVDGVSLEVRRGSTLALVGESGSGKTTAALAVMRLVPLTAGSMHLGDTDIGGARRAKRCARCGGACSMIFQDPFSSLNPRQRAGDAVRAPLELMRHRRRRANAKPVSPSCSPQVGLRPEQQRLFPHQFSGGQRQRINIARALATQPELVICDEPVSALDVAIRAQILNLLQRLQRELGLTYLFISHDMAVVEHICDDIAVMYLGQIVERAPRRQFFAKPLHPYSVALMSAVPTVHGGRRRAALRIKLSGDPPSPIDPATRLPLRRPLPGGRSGLQRRVAAAARSRARALGALPARRRGRRPAAADPADADGLRG